MAAVGRIVLVYRLSIGGKNALIRFRLGICNRSNWRELPPPQNKSLIETGMQIQTEAIYRIASSRKQTIFNAFDPLGQATAGPNVSQHIF